MRMSIEFAEQERWWDAMAAAEEIDAGDERINRELRWREIDRNLAGISTILDIGAGQGAFSIPLASRGYSVTHLDFSSAMLERAETKARQAGVADIEFVKANVIDLSLFDDRCFDLVLNMDGAISFCGSEAERALAESIRVTGKRIILSVSHTAALLPFWLQASFELCGGVLPAVGDLMERRIWDPDLHPENRALSARLCGGYLGPIRSYLPDELKRAIEARGMRVVRIGGIGTLSYLYGPRLMRDIEERPDYLEPFLELCDHFDRELMVDGPGTRHRAGLIATAQWAKDAKADMPAV